MESRQFYISVSEGVYDSWHAIGVLEGLHTDGDVGQFLVTLYSSQKQREGGESGLRCVHCHSPLSLHCTACHHPSLLTLPPHPPSPSLTSPPPPHPPSLSSPPPPHLPSPSLTSPPPPHLPSPSLSSPPPPHLPSPSLTSPPPPHLPSPSLSSPPPPHLPSPSLTSPPPPLPPQQVLDTLSPVSGDTDTVNTPVLGSEKQGAYVGAEKEGAGLSQDEGEFEFDDCPVDFGAVEPESPFGAFEDEPGTSEPAPTVDLETSTSVRRRQSRTSGTKKSAVSPHRENRKKRSAGTLNTFACRPKRRKVLKKNQHVTNNSVTDCVRKGNRDTRQNNHDADDETTDADHTASDEGVNLQDKDRDESSDETQEDQSKEQKKGKIFASDNLGDGFILPAKERHSAEIHMFDDSFFKYHRIENKLPKCVKQKSSSDTNKSLRTHNSEDISQKQEVLDTETVEDVGSNPQMESSSESCGVDESDRSSLRILVSGQKIPPIKTADGSYTRSLYTHFECLLCKKAYTHKRSFNKHIQTHVEENLYKCTLCNKGFESLYNLTEHEKKHKFECEICGKKCTEKNDYNTHMKLHTENDGVMKCPGCSYQSTDFYVYRKHKYECAYLRPALQCEVCGVHLKSVKSLKHHIAAIHKNDRPYKCSLCEKSFVFKTMLNCHMKYNHAEGGRLFHCDKCGNRFIDPKGLKSHQKSVHSSEKPFKCSHCPSAFARKYTLGVHMRLHTGEKPFRCTECLQAFVQKPSLLLHLKSHHGQQSKVNKVQAEAENGP